MEEERVAGMLGCESGLVRTDGVETEILWEESREGLEVCSCGFCVGD